MQLRKLIYSESAAISTIPRIVGKESIYDQTHLELQVPAMWPFQLASTALTDMI